MPAKRMRVCMRAFLGDGGGAAQLRINLRIKLRERMNDLLRLIFIDNFNRMPFAGRILVTKLGFRRHGHVYRRGWARIKCHAAESDDRKGEDFSHKARVLSNRLAASASSFFG